MIFILMYFMMHALSFEDDLWRYNSTIQVFCQETIDINCHYRFTELYFIVFFIYFSLHFSHCSWYYN